MCGASQRQAVTFLLVCAVYSGSTICLEGGSDIHVYSSTTSAKSDLMRRGEMGWALQGQLWQKTVWRRQIVMSI